ncbi:hypothetical protein [Sphingobium limneticum]|uniref:DUF4136 domain-containing protein n=1 Tax=Sphingobium limneticum TaxID=1007511 RepID=A0A5J5I471_9SPHN|nr:hypothetical protein [Sphingobium limneticum]KAA9017515.1 hypothetical protein F4U96_09900 [Sphingobium limneticum]KAA9030106.1 hypothetical protein F4U95_09845 [Sphingobium limneticum]
MSKRLLFLAAIALPFGACATAAPRVEVTRFHMGNPARSGTVAVEEMPGNPDISLEFRTYAGAVSQEFQRVGFSATGDGAQSDYVALVSFSRTFRPSGPDRSSDRPVSVGMGGGIGSGGGRRGGTFGGLGLGVGINLSGKPKDIVTTELHIQLRRRSDSTAIWEGRASTQAKQGSAAAQPAAAAQKLAAALIGGYPGESGRTIMVK